MADVPTVTIGELSTGTTDPTMNPAPKKVLTGILNDFMNLQFGNETPYTTGQTVIPAECTLDDVDKSIADTSVEKKFNDIFVKIAETHRSGDLTPQSKNLGWDPKLTPVLVFVTPNP